MRPLLASILLAAVMSPAVAPLFAQSAPGAAAAPPVGVVEGRVVHADSTTPLAGAVVSVPQWGLADTTDANGRYRLSDVPAGAWIVEIESSVPGVDGILRTARVGRDSGTALDIVLPASTVVACADVSRVVPAPRTPTSTPAPASAGEAADGGVRVWWSPASPVQGASLMVNVRTVAGSDLTGTLAGEPLHFAEVEPGVYRAVGAIPIDSAGSVGLRVMRVGASALPDSRQLAVARGDYRMERLTVAPRFGAAPSAAVARRSSAESALAYAMARGAHETPRLWTEPFMLPRASRVTSGFGDGREFNGAVQSRHMGVDLAGATGAPIHAANRGVVRLVSDFYYAGTAVYIDHGGGLSTGYFHMSRADVAIGDTVSRGQVIGRVGQTGRVTGPHLHWIARYGGVTVDARSLLALEPLPAPECVTAP
ncbi:MAG TPA: peptidoglycan DD-metalloendopeptidase family protein [Gemmatimonadaceae bacterium]|nr:peptidoglycan DD-metalloendopeptidase family protein [Gemmatimonadaceae bacterium]